MRFVAGLFLAGLRLGDPVGHIAKRGVQDKVTTNDPLPLWHHESRNRHAAIKADHPREVDPGHCRRIDRSCCSRVFGKDLPGCIEHLDAADRCEALYTDRTAVGGIWVDHEALLFDGIDRCGVLAEWK